MNSHCLATMVLAAVFSGHAAAAEPDAAVICEKAAVASSMKGNPLPLTGDEMRQILFAAL